MPWTAAGAGEVAAAAEGRTAGALGLAAAAVEGRAGVSGDDGSWSGGVGRGSGATAHPRQVGMSPTSLRHCRA